MFLPAMSTPTRKTRFLDLPVRDTAAGRPRRVGVEIELAGLGEEVVADFAMDCLGGTVAETGPHEFEVRQSALGTVKVFLDTAFRDPKGSEIVGTVLEIGRSVVPVEIATAPIEPAHLPRLAELAERLREAGARGTGGGPLLGLGLHLNVEVAAETAAAIAPVVRAFALLEDWLRRARPIDLSRRMLPFVDPYPRALVDRLAGADDWTLDALTGAYLAESPSRNRGLDLLPLLGHLAPGRVEAALGDGTAVKARPAYHYRLPDCRIDEADWSLADEWNRWCFVERVAGDASALDALARAWVAHRSALTTVRTDWHRTVARILHERGLTADAAA